ncbi:hypothetical protein I7107_004783 [Vibrio parahaemolyticus]|nr:hypothetical protein [Vibrio parahaemolyticus]EGQ8200647.1 hypothetical protein [Vibrio parahaemolyticus]
MKPSPKHMGISPKNSALVTFSSLATNAALRCEQRLAILERSENAKRCESLLNALLCL